MSEQLLSFFQNNRKYSLNELYRLLGAFEKSKIKAELEKLELEGKIISNGNQYQIFPNNFKIVNIKIDRNGNGYFYRDEVKCTICKHKLYGALNNDLCVINMDTKTVSKILKRQSELITATLSNGNLISMADNKIILKNSDFNKIVEGNVVLLRINSTENNDLYCDLVEIIGHIDDPDIYLKTIALSKSFNINFTSSYIKELEKIPNEVSEEEIVDRLDLRNELIYTIDGDNTKDMDDAISVKIEDDNYIVGIHISDVSYYVKPGSIIFDEAYNRATSLYMVDTVIPMIDHYLSNGICSLNPNTDRLTISCIIKLDKEGNVLDYKIVKSVINSKMKMTYSKVNEILMHNNIPEGYEEFVDNLKLANEVSRLLNSKNKNNAYLQFGNREIKYYENSFDLIVPQAGEKIIEMFMLLANKVVAENFQYMPFSFRIHEIPNAEDISQAFSTIKAMGYDLPNLNINNLIDNPIIFQKVLKELYESGNYSITSYFILKSMKKARYSPVNIGHFGLGFECYTHFTSPIRRFNDLLVHAIVSNYIGRYDEKQLTYLNNNLYQMCEHISEKELLADEAEKEALNYKMAEYMEDHVGEYYNGKIIDLNSSYATVKLTNNIIGISYLKDFDNGYYFNGNTYQLENKENAKTYSVGDYVRVKITYVNKTLRKINFKVTENIQKVKIKALS